MDKKGILSNSAAFLGRIAGSGRTTACAAYVPGGGPALMWIIDDTLVAVVVLGN
jgi:hypothetical protein